MARHVLSRQARDRTGVAVLTLLAFALAACTELPASGLAEQHTARPQLATVGTASPNATARSTPTPTRSGEPLVLGTDPRAGSISGGLLYGWKFDGRSGTLTPDPPAQPGSGRSTSPSGRWVEPRNVMDVSGTFIERTDLWLVDTLAGTERLLYSPPELPPQQPGKNVQPNPNIPPYPFQRTEYPISWSPDERYLTMWRVESVSASGDADGRPLVVIDIATGALTDLGYALYGYAGAWRAPHTLAYVAGAGRETWLNKTLSVWTPESGPRALTVKDEVGLAPAWGPDGRLWFASGPAGPYDVPTFFSGRGIGDRSIYSLDLATGRRTSLSRIAGYADEGVRVSDDGRLMLIERRKLDPSARTGQSPESWLELWLANVDGSDAHALLRVSATNGFGYYGGFSSLANLTWRH